MGVICKLIVFLFNSVLASTLVNYNNNALKIQNKIPIVNKYVFASYDVSNLISVEMVNCEIKSLDNSSFESMRKLEELLLNNNTLVELPKDVFQNSLNLVDLILDYNMIRALDNGVFANLFSLEVLSLHHNDIQIVDGHVFDDLTELTYLHIGENHIEYIDEDILQNTKKLNELNLGTNNLTNLKEGIFSQLTRLTELYLDHNKLTSLDSGIFDKNIALKVINLGYNRLEQVADNLFSKLVNLKSLSLYDNRIKQIGVNIFPTKNSLTSLYLESNELHSVDAKVFMDLKGLLSFRLDDNPWLCDCKLKDLVDKFRNMDFPTGLLPVCLEPKALKGKNWRQLDTSDLVCAEQLYTTESTTPKRTPVGYEVSWLATLSTSETCGTRVNTLPSNGVTRPVHTIVGGRPAEAGEYPWLTALYNSTLKFICGGSLVSNKHVITAAHCIRERLLYVELGRYNREDIEMGVIIREANNIVSYPGYIPNTGHGDIAVLILSEKVAFTTKIIPICLWAYDHVGAGQNGTVAGWGSDQSGNQSPAVMQTTVDIVSWGTCLRANKLFLNITSQNTFCAGGKGSGPCVGDSGSGLYVHQAGRWYLRGVVSISLGPTTTSCNTNLYAVYADITKYMDWLKFYLL